MIFVDYLIMAAAAGLVATWWLRHDTGKTASATLLLLFGLWALFDYRWQGAFGVGVGLIVLASLGIARLRSRKTRSGRPILSGTLVTLLGVLSIAPVYLFPVTHIPAPTGKHAVGVRDFVLSDADRTGLYVAADDEPRKLLVRVWYPAQSAQGLRRRPYFTVAEAQTTAKGLGSIIGAPFAFQHLKHVNTNSYVDAPLLSGATNLPTVIYSHGYTSFAGQNTALMEALASHGYVAYSIQHSHDASDAVLPDGSVLPMDSSLRIVMSEMAEQGISQAQMDAFTGDTYEIRRRGTLQNYQESVDAGQRLTVASAKVWLDDRVFVHDNLQQGKVPGSVADVVAASKLDATGQIGMSFGGSTTGGLCMVDRRCAAAANLDGGDYHGTPFNRQQPQPFLMLYSDYQRIAELIRDEPGPVFGFNDFSYERHELAGLNPDILRIKVNDVAHLGVSDFNLFMRNPLRAVLLGGIPGLDMVQIQNDFVLGFFDTHLRGKNVDFPNAHIAKHDRWIDREDLSPLRAWWLAEHQEDKTMRVVMETNLGDIEIALYPDRAPISAANFLAYVEGGHYDGASFYRVVHKQVDKQESIGVVQGGLLAEAMAGDGSDYAAPNRPLDPIAHETTDTTGILNERGTIAYARLDPGTAGSEFFFNVSDNEILDTGKGGRNRDGHGYATFGRVLGGMRVLERIQNLPADADTGIELVRGQILGQPITIHRAYVADEEAGIFVPHPGTH